MGTIVEHDLVSEAGEMRLVADLTRRRASPEEIESELRNHDDASKERKVLTLKTLKAKQDELRKAEELRQKECVVDFEKECALAAEKIATLGLSQSLDVLESRAKTLETVIGALQHK